MTDGAQRGGGICVCERGVLIDVTDLNGGQFNLPSGVYFVKMMVKILH